MSYQTIVDMALTITSLHDTAQEQHRELVELRAELAEKEKEIKRLLTGERGATGEESGGSSPDDESRR